jgi:hypothetical protein|tara:strand:- start:795 stop:920 length:126 start_codon:yes stop_codon:yes gene_type:complete
MLFKHNGIFKTLHFLLTGTVLKHILAAGLDFHKQAMIDASK